MVQQAMDMERELQVDEATRVACRRVFVGQVKLSQGAEATIGSAVLRIAEEFRTDAREIIRAIKTRCEMWCQEEGGAGEGTLYVCFPVEAMGADMIIEIPAGEWTVKGGEQEGAVNTITATSREIQQAGGLEKWTRKVQEALPELRGPALRKQDVPVRNPALQHPSEHEEQKTLMQELVPLHLGRWPELGLLFAIPNGGNRDPAVAGKLRAEGVKAGVSDLFLSVARGGHHGLYVEMKSMVGRETKEQKAWGVAVSEQGYAYRVARGAVEAWGVIEAYLRGEL